MPSVPELVHPGAGCSGSSSRYECLADPRKRLDAVAVEAQSTEADKQRMLGDRGRTAGPH